MISYSNFEGINLSGTKLYPYCFYQFIYSRETSLKELNKEENHFKEEIMLLLAGLSIAHISIVDSNFKNTGLEILPMDPLVKTILKNEKNDGKFYEELKSGRLSGCYYNGIKILSQEELVERKSEEQAKYETFKEKQFASVRNSLAKEFKKTKPRKN